MSPIAISNIVQRALGSESPSEANDKLVNQYLKKITWKGKENSNSTYSLQGLNQFISTEVVSNYWLNTLYTDEIRRYYKENRFHIHDMGFLSAYCAGWSTEDLITQGFGGVVNKVQCRPPAHFNTALNQIVNFFFTVQGELAGAQALSNFDTFLAPFVRADGLTYNEVFKCVQSFVYSLNVPTRAGFQSPFTNLSFDLVCPSTLKGHPVVLKGVYHESWIYDDFQVEMDMINKAFCAVMVEGDGNGNIFSFPIPTYNLYEGFDWDAPRYQPIWSMTAKYGVPYFANFINSNLNPDDFRSMCCRLRLDISELRSRGGMFSSMPLTGSVGVVTVNLPNLALRSGTKEGFMTMLDDTLRVAKDCLEIKRKVVDSHRELYPYAAHYLDAVYQKTGSCWSNHFNTIGIIGMDETMRILLGHGIQNDKPFAQSVIDFVKDRLKKFQLETGHFFNLEATPAEGACYKLAKNDREIFGDDKGIPTYYTNSTMLPVDTTTDILEAAEHQESLQSSYTGGTVFHAFLGEKLPNGAAAKNLVKMLATGYRIPYITLSPTFSICGEHGYLSGEQPACPQCNKPTLVYSRVVGFYRPTCDWNAGKKKEFEQRRTYDRANLEVAGFEEQSESASVMYTALCNVPCVSCDKGHVVRAENKHVTLEEIVESVSKSSHKTLVISGGEPTTSKGLVSFLRLLKRVGITVKLETNGTNPDVLRKIFAEKLVDSIAMDIKCALSDYKTVEGRHIKREVLEESFQLIRNSGVSHEFCATVVPGLIGVEDLAECKRLAGGKLTIKRFRACDPSTSADYKSHREHTEREFEEIVKDVETM